MKVTCDFEHDFGPHSVHINAISAQVQDVVKLILHHDLRMTMFTKVNPQLPLFGDWEWPAAYDHLLCAIVHAIHMLTHATHMHSRWVCGCVGRHVHACMCVCVRAYVHACVRVCVRGWVRVCVHV